MSVNLARIQRALHKCVPHLRKSLRSAHHCVKISDCLLFKDEDFTSIGTPSSSKPWLYGRQVHHRFATPPASLGDIRDVCFCLLAFAGFLRFDELSRLRWSDISFFQDHIELYVSKSKVDQLGKGCTLVIASTGTPAYPCAMLLRYAALARCNLDSVEFVFQNLSFFLF